MTTDDEFEPAANGRRRATRWKARADYGAGKFVNLRIAVVFAAGCAVFALFALISIALAEPAVATFSGVVSVGCFVMTVRYALRRQRLSEMREF